MDLEYCSICGTKINEKWVMCPNCTHLWKCPECKNEIEPEWKVCPFCTTPTNNNVEVDEVDEVDNNIAIKNVMDELDRSHKTHYEKIVSKLPFPYPLSWIIIGQIIYSIHYIAANITNEQFYSFNDMSWMLALIFSILMTIVTWAAKLNRSYFINVRRILDMSLKESEKFYDYQLNRTLGDRNMIIMGLFTGLFFTITVYQLGFWYENQLVIITYMSLLFFVGYAGGQGLMGLLGTIFMVHDIGNSKLHLNPYLPDNVGGLKPLGELTLKYAIVAGIFLFVPIVWIYNSPWAHMEYFTYIAGLWIITGYLIAIFTFITPLISVHDAIMKFKQEELDEIISKRDYLIKENSTNSNSQVLQKITSNTKEEIEMLDDSYDVIHSLHSWPFDFKIIGQLLSSLTIPIVMLYLEYPEIFDGILRK